MAIDAAGDGGSMQGLPRNVAQKLAAHTMIVRLFVVFHFSTTFFLLNHVNLLNLRTDDRIYLMISQL